VLNSSLSFVDERLILKRPALISEFESHLIAIRSKVFISYRRQDSAPYTRLIRQSLAKYMNEQEIFMDIDTIEDGEDFIDSIAEAVSSCDVMLVVIGNQWGDAKTNQGEQRIFLDNDFVRLEIATALQQGCHVIPILVGGAQMPSADQLPDDLEPLWRLHARELSDTRWEYDIEQLAGVIAE
jgi:hypothetical protein